MILQNMILQKKIDLENCQNLVSLCLKKEGGEKVINCANLNLMLQSHTILFRNADFILIGSILHFF